MNSYAYYNGKFGKRSDISIPLNDRTIFFGDAIYEAAIGQYDRILWESEHIERLFANAKALSIHHDYSEKTLSDILREVAIKSCIDSYLIYFSLSRSSAKREHSAKHCNGTNLLITVDPITIDENPARLRLTVKEDLRYKYCNVKTVNLLPNVIALTKAENDGFDEVVFHKNGIVTECAKSNISILKRGRLITHPLNNEILPGITRRHVIDVCNRLDIPCLEEKFNLSDMYSADEIIVSSSSKLCRSAIQIDGISVGGKDSYLLNKICCEVYKEYETKIINPN